jgi:Hint domain
LFKESLIPVMYLINEASIAQGMPSDMSGIEYYHIELDTHEVIYAEGALVESFFDDGSNRAQVLEEMLDLRGTGVSQAADDSGGESARSCGRNRRCLGGGEGDLAREPVGIVGSSALYIAWITARTCSILS